MTGLYAWKQDLKQLALRVRRNRLLGHAARRGIHFGHCPICERYTFFYLEGNWLRDHFRCFRCLSIPRFRALVTVLNEHFPNWRAMRIHESSPGGASSDKLALSCSEYTPTHFFPNVPLGAKRDGVRCENLERQTFDDEQFDLVVTQDVFEHILNPELAFAEIARTLRPGGAHVFTVPWFYWKPTLIRARELDGEVVHLLPPSYHGNPIDSKGSLVITEWGDDLFDVIYRTSGLTTTAIRIYDRRAGIDAKFIEVFISTKRSADGVGAYALAHSATTRP